jgi:hypothetical protein
VQETDVSKIEVIGGVVERAVRDLVGLSGDIKVIAMRIDAFEGEMRSRMASAEDRSERRMAALEARVDRQLMDFDSRLRSIEQSLSKLMGFMGQIEGRAAAMLVDRAIELQSRHDGSQDESRHDG